MTTIDDVKAAALAIAAVLTSPAGKMDKAANLNDVADKPTARVNIGLATTSDAGGAANRVPLTDGTGKIPAALLPSAGAFPQGYLFPRSILSWTSATVVAIAAGAARDDTNAANLTFGALTLNTATIGANGVDVALTNGQTIHCFVIYNPTTTTYAAFGSSSLTPTLPTGYTLKRRVASLRCTPAATTLPQFYNIGDEFFYQGIATENAGFAMTANTPQTFSLGYVPTGLSLKLRGKIGNAGAALWIDNPSVTQVFPNGSLQTMSAYFAIEHVYCNTSAQIRIVQQTATTIAFSIEGWWDTREA